jgi:hypothetical protein
MKQTTKVIEIKETPSLKNPAIMVGIRDKAAAQRWGEKNGYAVVYFITRRQKVYAEKLTAKVDALAKDLHARSAELREMAETMVAAGVA